MCGGRATSRSANELGQPVLVGTISIEKSEKLSAMLKKRGVKHVVLNAKHHENEAEIVAQAGRVGAVTIATNMAGRGTDIVLGGNPEFLARRALAERGIKPGRHTRGGVRRGSAQALEQAKAECKDGARQGHRARRAVHHRAPSGTSRGASTTSCAGAPDVRAIPVPSRFYLSLDDDLMRIFAGEKLKAAMKTLGMEEDVPIESPMVSRSIERAQKQVETRNFEIRKHLLEYDDVNNKQRNEIYGLRRGLLEGQRADASTCWRRHATSWTCSSTSTWRPSRIRATGRSSRCAAAEALLRLRPGGRRT